MKTSFLKFRWVPCVAMLLSLGCASSQLLREKDYEFSNRAARQLDLELALQEFPQKEKGGFITTLEKAHLSFFDRSRGRGSEVKELLSLSRSFEGRKWVSISREAGVFLSQEGPDGYIPSEPEAVALSLTAAQYLLQQEQIESAQVELRKANEILQGRVAVTPQGVEQNFFDDPALRVWTGALWLSAGDWGAAQVDFRRASELEGVLSEQKRRLRQLSELPAPPKGLRLRFRGVGPETTWKEESFVPEFSESIWPARAEDLGSASLSFGTSAWMRRHLLRNSELRDLMLKSNYMSQYLTLKAASGADRAAGTGVATTIKLGAVVAGTLIIGGALYAASIAPVDGEAVAYVMMGGFLVGRTIWAGGDAFEQSYHARVKKDEQQKLESMRTYRFVRFLPQVIELDWDPVTASSCSTGVQLPAGLCIELSNR